MMRSASGTYSLPSACMKSYWVSTSQKITRGMARNLFGGTGTCQQDGRGVSRSHDRRLQTQHDRDLIAAVLPGTACAVRPHLERELLALGGHEAELQEERGLARQGEHLVQPLRTRFGGERLEQRPADPRSLPPRMHGETRDLGEPTRIDLQGAASHDLVARGRGVGEYRAPHCDAGQRYGKSAHASTCSRMSTARSRSASVTTRGGIRRRTP